jgi:hypothetical protein
VQSAFWATLAADFHTRYVVFEFKNYSGPITQDQVYATEKYLKKSALRSVAIVVAKNGAAESAIQAMRGADGNRSLTTRTPSSSAVLAN